LQNGSNTFAVSRFVTARSGSCHNNFGTTNSGFCGLWPSRWLPAVRSGDDPNAVSEVVTNDGFAVVTPATVAYVNVIVGDATAAPVEPVEVIEKPQRQLVFPAITGGVAVAVPAASLRSG
jgi:hypothetical protein